MTRATLKTVIGETVNTDFEDSDTPRDVLRNACRKDLDMMVPFFGTVDKARKFAEDGVLNIQTSQFSLVNGAEKAISFDFDIPILEQIPGDKKMGANDSLTFLVTADTVVGGLVARMPTVMRVAIPRMTNEMKAYTAFAEVLGKYLGDGVSVSARPRGSDVEIIVRNFPVYADPRRRTVLLQLPGGLLNANRENVNFKSPLGSASVKILMDNGKAFPHCHVWDCGMPCWNDNTITNMAELFTTFVNTLTWMNISNDSRMYGHFTNCVCTKTVLSKKNPWAEISGQRKAVSRALGFEVESRDPLNFFCSNFGRALANAMG